MKLIIAIAHDWDKHKLADALLENGLSFTKLGSTGGFLRQGNVTVLVGAEDDDVPRVFQVIQAACGAFPPHPLKVETGGAVAFVLSVDHFQRF